MTRAPDWIHVSAQPESIEITCTLCGAMKKLRPRSGIQEHLRKARRFRDRHARCQTQKAA